MAKKIVRTPGTCGGEPRIEGHRLTCANVILSIDYGRLYSYLKDYPDLTVEDIRACLAYCASRQCIQDQPESFCFRCILDTKNFDELNGEEPEKTWKIAQGFLDDFDVLSECVK